MSDEYESADLSEDRKQKYRDQYGWCDLLTVIKRMNEVREEKELREDQLKIINAEYDVLRLELIPAKMEEAGIENMRVEGIGRVSLTGDMYVRVTDQQHFYEWLESNNLGDLIKPTVASSTLKAFVKNRIKAGKDLPDAVLKVTPFTRASITKA